MESMSVLFRILENYWFHIGGVYVTGRTSTIRVALNLLILIVLIFLE